MASFSGWMDSLSQGLAFFRRGLPDRLEHLLEVIRRQIIRFNQPQVAGQLLGRLAPHRKTAEKIGLPFLQLIQTWRNVLETLDFVQHDLDGVGGRFGFGKRRRRKDSSKA